MSITEILEALELDRNARLWADAKLQRYIEDTIIGEDEDSVDEDPEGNLVADWDEEMIARNALRAEQRKRLRGNS